MSKKRPDPFLTDDDNPEWTKEDFARAKPIREVDPGMLEAVKVPNRVTARTLRKSERGEELTRLSSAEELFKALKI